MYPGEAFEDLTAMIDSIASKTLWKLADMHVNEIPY
jgi:hypothetical protein